MGQAKAGIHYLFFFAFFFFFLALALFFFLSDIQPQVLHIFLSFRKSARNLNSLFAAISIIGRGESKEDFSAAGKTPSGAGG